MHEQWLQKRLSEARDDFHAIVSRLVETYPVERIYQWGSLVDGHHFSEISDIDIAVEGTISAETYAAMLGDAIRLTKFPVDLLDLRRLSHEQAMSIRERGEVVYERAGR